MRSYVIGRSPYADIVLPDTSVARRHAELVVTDDGRFYLTDCATETGTWRRIPVAEGGESWERLRQAFVTAEEPLRFGEQRATLSALVGRPDPQGAAPDGRWRWDGPPEPAPDKPRGRVERDPLTGEIVAKRV